MSTPADAGVADLYHPGHTAEAFARDGVTVRTCRALIQELRERLLESFTTNPTGAPIVQARTALVDDLVRAIWAELGAARPASARLALIAVGGYGRGELHPYSDIDLLILGARGGDLRRADGFIRAFVTFLWDIGLEVGHSVRSLAECVSEARGDITTITNLVEARLLTDPTGLYPQLRARTAPDRVWSVQRFFAAKLAEQQARHNKFDATAYKLEPNVKESPGGLRDIHTICWVTKRHFGAKHLGDLVEHGFLEADEYGALSSGQDFLSQVRNGLHLLAGRKDDHLTFDRQREFALRFGYTDGPEGLAVEQFMKRYYRTVMEISRLSEMLLQHFEEEILLARTRDVVTPINRRFQARKGYLEVAHPSVFQRHPFALLELFLLLEQRPELRGVRAGTIRLVRRGLDRIDDAFRLDLRCTSLFMEIMRQPAGVGHELQRMNRYGVLARYLPAFGRVVGQMQHDLFHIYTVDEHSLIVLRNTRSYAFPEEKIPALALGYEVFQRLPKPELLYLAALFHDIGKGQGGDHSRIGEEVAYQFGIRHGLSEYDSRLIAWLVRQHLVMSRISQREDIADPDVITAFASRVGDQVHLDYLYLLTIADMRGTSPTVWNSWKGSLLTTLYLGTRRALRRDLAPVPDAEARTAEVKTQARVLLAGEALDSPDPEKVWQRLDADYFLRFTPPEIAWHTYNLLRAKPDQTTLVATRDFPDHGGTGVMVYARDRAHLFATVTTALDRLNLDIVDARIYTTADGYALDSFIVLGLDGLPIADAARRREIRAALRSALAPEVLSPRAVTRRITRTQKAFAVPTEVSFHSDTTRGRTVVELISADRPGLLSRVALVLADAGVRLDRARVNTYGERAEDVFVISTADGRPMTDEALLARIKTDLIAVLTDNVALPASG